MDSDVVESTVIDGYTMLQTGYCILKLAYLFTYCFSDVPHQCVHVFFRSAVCVCSVLFAWVLFIIVCSDIFGSFVFG